MHGHAHLKAPSGEIWDPGKCHAKGLVDNGAGRLRSKLEVPKLRLGGGDGGEGGGGRYRRGELGGLTAFLWLRQAV